MKTYFGYYTYDTTSITVISVIATLLLASSITAYIISRRERIERNERMTSDKSAKSDSLNLEYSLKTDYTMRDSLHIASMVTTILLSIILVNYPAYAHVTEVEKIGNTVETYIETLDIDPESYTSVVVVDIQRLRFRDEKLTANVVYTEKGIAKSSEMPVIIEDGDKPKPYITYRTLDKSYKDIMGHNNVLAKLDKFKVGDKLAYTVHISKEDYKDNYKK